jgi:hypothetical protein
MTVADPAPGMVVTFGEYPSQPPVISSALVVP